MSHWVWRGLATGVRTTAYPDRPETAPGTSPGLPLGGAMPPDAMRDVIDCCPTGALVAGDGEVEVRRDRCVHCFRCSRQVEWPLAWSSDHEWAALGGDPATQDPFDAAFRQSLHILVVDAGDCGACLHEVRQLTNPWYNIHRLGFFFTPTPRHADLLLVVGPVTEQMRLPLQKAYNAMPTPRRVIAVGACALSGGVFGPSFTSEGGVAHVLPVDVAVPGQPPPPLAILHALMVAAGRRPPSPPLDQPVPAGPRR